MIKIKFFTTNLNELPSISINLYIIMGNIKSFEDLEVWQMGKQIVNKVYSLTKKFPNPNKAKFYLNARGSLYELMNLKVIYLYQKNIEGLSLKINNLIDSTRRKSKSQ